MNSRLIKPLVTEKSMQDAALSRFTFKVNPAANKAEIAKEAKKTFGIDVVSIKTMTIKGQAKRAGRRRLLTKSSPWKKAVIEAKKGQKVDLFDTTEHAQKS